MNSKMIKLLNEIYLIEKTLKNSIERSFLNMKEEVCVALTSKYSAHNVIKLNNMCWLIKQTSQDAMDDLEKCIKSAGDKND